MKYLSKEIYAIPNNAFYLCSRLETVIIGEGVEKLELMLFKVAQIFAVFIFMVKQSQLFI